MFFFFLVADFLPLEGFSSPSHPLVELFNQGIFPSDKKSATLGLLLTPYISLVISLAFLWLLDQNYYTLMSPVAMAA